MPENPSTPASFATVVKKYRETMAAYLEASLGGMNSYLSQVHLDGALAPTSPAQVEEDPTIHFRKLNSLLMTKARLHAVAAIRANQENNIHSLAVQMRPALECAGQVVSAFEDVFGRPVDLDKRLREAMSEDRYRTALRLWKGQLDPEIVTGNVCDEDPSAPDPAQEAETVAECEKVRSLQFGENWYRHLGRCFVHSDLSALKGHSFGGGVRSSNTVKDDHAFACLLDYMAHLTLGMVVVASASSCRDDPSGNDRRLDKAVEWLTHKRSLSETFRKQRNSWPGDQGSLASLAGTIP